MCVSVWCACVHVYYLGQRVCHEAKTVAEEGGAFFSFLAATPENHPPRSTLCLIRLQKIHKK